MVSGNPFADSDDIDSTVIKPAAMSGAPAQRLVGIVEAPPSAPPPPRGLVSGTTGPAPVHAAPTAPPRFVALDERVVAALAQATSNPLLNLAGPLLVLAAGQRDLTMHYDVDGLRNQAIAELRRFETAGLAAGLPSEQIRVARYALCATIDDIVLNTPWGSQSSWQNKSLVSIVHKETFGGERFFELLERMQSEPARYLPELELFYVCLSLGFEGKFRVLPRGSNDLSYLRDVLFRLIQHERGAASRDLAPHWRGVTETYRPLSAVINLWVVLGVIAAATLGLFLGLSVLLERAGGEVQTSMGNLLPTRPATVARIVAPPPPAPAQANADPSLTAVERVSQFLQADITAGNVEVIEAGSAVVVRMLGSTPFATGKDTLNPGGTALVGRIGQALINEAGSVVITGHTDNVPMITGRGRFASNQALSLARATSVMRLLTSTLGASRLSAEGLGDTQPIASNATPDGRQRNRRVEVTLYPPQQP